MQPKVASAYLLENTKAIKTGLTKKFQHFSRNHEMGFKTSSVPPAVMALSKKAKTSQLMWFLTLQRH